MKSNAKSQQQQRISPYLLRPRRSLAEALAQSREARTCAPHDVPIEEDEPEHLDNRAFGE